MARMRPPPVMRTLKRPIAGAGPRLAFEKESPVFSPTRDDLCFRNSRLSNQMTIILHQNDVLSKDISNMTFSYSCIPYLRNHSLTHNARLWWAVADTHSARRWGQSYPGHHEGWSFSGASRWRRHRWCGEVVLVIMPAAWPRLWRGGHRRDRMTNTK